MTDSGIVLFGAHGADSRHNHAAGDYHVGAVRPRSAVEDHDDDQEHQSSAPSLQGALFTALVNRIGGLAETEQEGETQVRSFTKKVSKVIGKHLKPAVGANAFTSMSKRDTMSVVGRMLHERDGREFLYDLCATSPHASECLMLNYALRKSRNEEFFTAEQQTQYSASQRNGVLLETHPGLCDHSVLASKYFPALRDVVPRLVNTALREKRGSPQVVQAIVELGDLTGTKKKLPRVGAVGGACNNTINPVDESGLLFVHAYMQNVLETLVVAEKEAGPGSDVAKKLAKRIRRVEELMNTLGLSRTAVNEVDATVTDSGNGGNTTMDNGTTVSSSAGRASMVRNTSSFVEVGSSWCMLRKKALAAKSLNKNGDDGKTASNKDAVKDAKAPQKDDDDDFGWLAASEESIGGDSNENGGLTFQNAINKENRNEARDADGTLLLGLLEKVRSCAPRNAEQLLNMRTELESINEQLWTELCGAVGGDDGDDDELVVLTGVASDASSAGILSSSQQSYRGEPESTVLFLRRRMIHAVLLDPVSIEFWFKMHGDVTSMNIRDPAVEGALQVVAMRLALMQITSQWAKHSKRSTNEDRPIAWKDDVERCSKEIVEVAQAATAHAGFEWGRDAQQLRGFTESLAKTEKIVQKPVAKKNANRPAAEPPQPPPVVVNSLFAKKPKPTSQPTAVPPTLRTLLNDTRPHEEDKKEEETEPQVVEEKATVRRKFGITAFLGFQHIAKLTLESLAAVSADRETTEGQLGGGDGKYGDAPGDVGCTTDDVESLEAILFGIPSLVHQYPHLIPPLHALLLDILRFEPAPILGDTDATVVIVVRIHSAVAQCLLRIVTLQDDSSSTGGSHTGVRLLTTIAQHGVRMSVSGDPEELGAEDNNKQQQRSSTSLHMNASPTGGATLLKVLHWEAMDDFCTHFIRAVKPPFSKEMARSLLLLIRGCYRSIRARHLESYKVLVRSCGDALHRLDVEKKNEAGGETAACWWRSFAMKFAGWKSV